ncbi:MAG TPA: hypothetical protein VK666_11585 [Chryseolinea sp.]|nr:hypothetical protein [Chryseolinea sp.]
MKLLTTCTLIFLFFITSLYSQKTDFAFVQHTVEGPGATPKLASNAYLAVSVLFRNEQKLADPDFLGKFNKVNYFYLEASVTDGQKTETAPLYFLKKDNGGIFSTTTFSTKVFKDRTILRKVPFQKYAASIPTVNISVNIKMEKEILKIIKDISSKIAPIVSNPESLFGAGSIKLVYGFFDNIIGQLNTSKEVQAEVAFDAFAPEETGIIPYRYSVVFLGPKNVQITGSKFKVRFDDNNSLQLYNDNTLYQDYPYMIVLTGLSNFLDIDGIPSKYYAQNKICEITGNELAKLVSTLEASKAKLSDDQMAAERNLIQLISYKVQIENGVVSSAEDKLVEAYNSFYDFKKYKPDALSDSLYSQHYKDIFTFYKGCIENSSQGLGLYKLLKNVFPVLDKDDVKTITNADLEILKTYIETTKTLNFILSSKFNANAITTQLLAEKSIYNTNFKERVDNVLNTKKITAETKIDINKLIDLKSQFDQCDKCVAETRKAEQYYGELVKTDNAKRKEIEDIVSQANATLSQGSTALQIIDLTKYKVDSANKPLLIVGLKVDEINSRLSRIKIAKEDLNRKLGVSIFSLNDKAEIETTMRDLKDLISMFKTDILSNVSTLVKDNNKILVANLPNNQLKYF